MSTNRNTYNIHTRPKNNVNIKRQAEFPKLQNNKTFSCSTIHTNWYAYTCKAMSSSFAHLYTSCFRLIWDKQAFKISTNTWKVDLIRTMPSYTFVNFVRDVTGCQVLTCPFEMEFILCISQVVTSSAWIFSIYPRLIHITYFHLTKIILLYMRFELASTKKITAYAHKSECEQQTEKQQHRSDFVTVWIRFLRQFILWSYKLSVRYEKNYME
jgi:hypothetical protein